MARRSHPRVDHFSMPLRPIIRSKRKDRGWITVMRCGHSAPGRPEDPSTAKFYPCPACHTIVQQARRKS